MIWRACVHTHSVALCSSHSVQGLNLEFSSCVHFVIVGARNVPSTELLKEKSLFCMNCYAEMSATQCWLRDDVVVCTNWRDGYNFTLLFRTLGTRYKFLHKYVCLWSLLRSLAWQQTLWKSHLWWLLKIECIQLLCVLKTCTICLFHILDFPFIVFAGTDTHTLYTCMKHGMRLYYTHRYLFLGSVSKIFRQKMVILFVSPACFSNFSTNQPVAFLCVDAHRHIYFKIISHAHNAHFRSSLALTADHFIAKCVEYWELRVCRCKRNKNDLN